MFQAHSRHVFDDVPGSLQRLQRQIAVAKATEQSRASAARCGGGAEDLQILQAQQQVQRLKGLLQGLEAKHAFFAALDGAMLQLIEEVERGGVDRVGHRPDIVRPDKCSWEEGLEERKVGDETWSAPERSREGQQESTCNSWQGQSGLKVCQGENHDGVAEGWRRGLEDRGFQVELGARPINRLEQAANGSASVLHPQDELAEPPSSKRQRLESPPRDASMEKPPGSAKFCENGSETGVGKPEADVAPRSAVGTRGRKDGKKAWWVHLQEMDDCAPTAYSGERGGEAPLQSERVATGADGEPQVPPVEPNISVRGKKRFRRRVEEEKEEEAEARGQRGPPLVEYEPRLAPVPEPCLRPGAAPVPETDPSLGPKSDTETDLCRGLCAVALHQTSKNSPDSAAQPQDHRRGPVSTHPQGEPKVQGQVGTAAGPREEGDANDSHVSLSIYGSDMSGGTAVLPFSQPLPDVQSEYKAGPAPRSRSDECAGTLSEPSNEATAATTQTMSVAQGVLQRMAEWEQEWPTTYYGNVVERHWQSVICAWAQLEMQQVCASHGLHPRDQCPVTLPSIPVVRYCCPSSNLQRWHAYTFPA